MMKKENNNQDMQQMQVLDMFKDLKSFMGATVCVCLSSNGKLCHKIGKLDKVNAFSDIEIRVDGDVISLPFIDIGSAILWISLVDSSECIYINSNVDYGYNITKLDELYDEKRKFYGDTVALKQRDRKDKKILNCKIEHYKRVICQEMEAIKNLQSLLALEKGKNNVIQSGVVLLNSMYSGDSLVVLINEWINLVSSINDGMMLDAYFLSIGYIIEINNGGKIDKIIDKLNSGNFRYNEEIVNIIRKFSLSGEEFYQSFVRKTGVKKLVLEK